MAFVQAAVSNTNEISLSGFFTTFPRLLASGADFYISPSQPNLLFIDDASPKLSSIGSIYSGLYAANGPHRAISINFSLFPNLSVLGFEGTYVRDIDLRYNRYFHSMAAWAGGSVSALRIAGFYDKNISYIDNRNSTYPYLNISGCNLGGLNLSEAGLTALDFKNGQIRNLHVGQSPLKVFDFSLCDTPFLTAIEQLTFNRWNTFSPNDNNRKLKYFNLYAPLSSIFTLSLAQNSLTSVDVPNFPTLRELFLGGNGKIYETPPFTPQLTLSANNINLNGLSGLYLLDLGGLGSLSSLYAINGINGLSSLRSLNVDNSLDLKDLNFSGLSALRNLYNLSVKNCPLLSSINFADFTFTNNPPGSYFLPNPFVNITNNSQLSALDISSLSGISDLYVSANNNLRSIVFPAVQSGVYNVSIDNSPFLGDLNFFSPYRDTVFAINLGFLSSLSSLDIRYLRSLFALTLNNLPSLSTYNFTGLSALKYVSFQSIGNQAISIELPLQGLSALETLNINTLPTLTSINPIFTFNNLKTINLTINNKLSSFNLDAPNLLYFSSSRNLSLEQINLNNRPLLNRVDVSQPFGAIVPKLSSISLANNPSLSAISIAGKNVLSALDLTGTNFLSSATIQNTYLRKNSFDPLNTRNLQYASFSNNYLLNNLNLSQATNLNDLECINCGLSNLNITNCGNLVNLNCSVNRLSSLNLSSNTSIENLICASNRLTSLDTTGLNSLYSIDAQSNKLTYYTDNNSNDLYTLYLTNNNLNELKLNPHQSLAVVLAINNSLTSIDLNVQSNESLQAYFNNNYISQININTPDIFELNVANNNLSSLNLSNIENINRLVCTNNALTSVTLSKKISSFSYVDTNNNKLNSKAIDSLFLQLCAGPVFGIVFDYSNNSSRTLYSDQMYSRLVNDFAATLVPDELIGTVGPATPEISIVSAPASLPDTFSFSLSANTIYLDTYINTFYGVVSGPGIINGNILTATSSSGTITVLVSSLSTTIFNPVSTLLNVQAAVIPTPTPSPTPTP
ncbi:MAG: hypothetical protein EBU90_06560, partial [Proteobacteria bacterium]|nr:hypothetical protein [Pseudomonadota bacterium]